jgi:hypothetical protein
MSKINKWKKKINAYYTEVQPPKLFSYLQGSGFKVGFSNEEKLEPINNLLASLKLRLLPNLTTRLFSKDSSVWSLLNNSIMKV